MDVGVVAAIGVALGAISTVLATVFTKVVELSTFQKIMLPILVIVAISGPAMIIAWFKLRKRNLGPILDANGWAVNAKAKLNVPFGASLTQIAELPPGSYRDLADPFEEKKSPWPKIIIVLLAVIALVSGLWYFGKLDEHLPAKMQSISILGTNAPAYVAPTNTIAPIISTNAPAAK